MNGGIREEFSNAWSKPNNAVVQLILINVIAFAAIRILEVFFIFSGSQELYSFLLKKLELPASFGTFLTQPWTIVTYFFLHYDFFHVLFNMLFLWKALVL